jgi:GGDEF domain-containing protein
LISIRKYLNGSRAAVDGDAGQSDPLVVLAGRLLAGIEQHGINGDYPEGVRFQQQVAALQKGLAGASSPEDIEALGAKAVEVLERHKQWVRDMQRQQAAEVQNMMAMLNRTVAVLSSGSNRSVDRLRRIEREIKKVAAIDDLVALKAHLADCLTYVQQETAREREEVAHTLASMEAEIEKARESASLARTGFPGRNQAKQAIAEAVGRKPPVLALLCVLDRFDSFHVRFGPAAADQFVTLFVEDLARRLPAPKRLFRWSVASLLALLDPNAGGDLRVQVRNAMQALPLERKLEMGNRVAVIAQPVRWSIVDLGQAESPAAVFEQMRQLSGETV